MSTPEINRLILVTGASGYVGGRLAKALVDDGLKVRVFLRHANKIQGQPWAPRVEIFTGNANNQSDLELALAGVHTAYYLLHSLNLGSDFDQIEAKMAKNFVIAAQSQGVKQIIYLGGIANDRKRSKHLASRARTGRELASLDIPVLELRAGIIIGSGSASFEMLRHLTHRLPIMTTPKWVTNRTQPISIRDVLYYLRKCAQLKNPVDKIFDIGGEEVLTYAEMMQKFAAISGLRKRWIIKVPVLTPNLSSHWIGLVTPVPVALARPLVGSLISEVIADPAKSINSLIPPPTEGLLTVEMAIRLALSKISDRRVETRWSDASVYTAPWQRAQSDPDWAGEALFHDIRQGESDLPIGQLWRLIEGIGGENGWYGVGFLWWIRGVMDRTIGGVGLRRGRRDPEHLRVGESLDFWRVEALEYEKRLRLYAEMILPGKAWLEFRLESIDGKTRVIQEATFAPRGLGGQLYWYLVLPFHVFVFPIMLRNIIKKAEAESQLQH